MTTRSCAAAVPMARPATAMAMNVFISVSLSRIQLLEEVRVQNPNLGDARDRQLVAVGDATNRLRRRAVVNAEGAFAIGRHVRVDPCNAIFGVVLHYLQAGGGARFGHGNVQTFGKIA